MDNDAPWEDVVEVSFVPPEGREMRWSAWAGGTAGALNGIPPCTYRLRASGTSRDQRRDGGFAEEPVDAYLLE